MESMHIKLHHGSSLYIMTAKKKKSFSSCIQYLNEANVAWR